MSRTVYIAETGCYENRYTAGIFNSPEEAMGGMHRDGWIWTRTLWHFKSPTVARGGGHQEWTNDQDWDDAVRIYEDTMDDEPMPRRDPDKIESWDDNKSGTGFIHKDLTAEEADAVVSENRNFTP